MFVTHHVRPLLITLVLVTFMLCGYSALAAGGSAPNPGPTAMSDMQTYRAMLTPDSAPASPVSGIEWSVFNHRGAGWFIFLWGLTAFMAGLQWPRRTWLRFVPPLMLLGLVEFLFLRNDPKTWPIGPVPFWISFQDPAVFQHRVFVVLIVVIAIIELLRAADRLPPLLRQFAFPSLALLGGMYLFFHKHGGLQAQQAMQNMAGPAMTSGPAMQNMTASMDLVKHQHLWFSIFGFGLAVTRLLADIGLLKGRLGATLWPVFAMALGIYMTGYSE
ncbi:MAG: hypothetical protein M3Z41_05380 [Candidatus Eremiobacteraeota bacterium]|nr:hypothetical protein [Candidatus Eremiobacteraeota bacterium]